MYSTLLARVLKLLPFHSDSAGTSWVSKILSAFSNFMGHGEITKQPSLATGWGIETIIETHKELKNDDW